MFTGCRHSTKPVFKVPPVLQASFVDVGGILQWSPSGKPFQVYWLNNQTPCLSTDSMVSDGTQNVVCHAFTPGSYKYDVDKPNTQQLPQGKTQIHTGVSQMHV